jgi:hypothetical protein
MKRVATKGIAIIGINFMATALKSNVEKARSWRHTAAKPRGSALASDLGSQIDSSAHHASSTARYKVQLVPR